MPQKLDGLKVAILVTDGFEQIEMTSPRDALKQAGAQPVLVSPNHDRVQGWDHQDKADIFPVDLPLDRADPNDFDALLLPGGVASPDKLRMNPKAVQFVRAFFDQHKPVAAICHGSWTLIDADAVRGRRMTSWPSLRTDLRNAGATWVDEEVVVDGNLITSRAPRDLPAFNRKVIEEFAAALAGARS
ncbi:MAG: type 1 glutamine amidotransferase [Phycisphaerae bacterium]|jgi:protease I|nr:type 1 glutamine amidotransferase [Phycisphaerae bacterium]HOO16825.1 type 1 glutamine amidotransferase domain-containing protein [Phycisphaerae bacterium]HPC22647.1 type 1 glutamine amidotransferase domain-containing protein [Phycisphaerae bacterium]HRS27000.1 type 1 glutamine amidotransferase domain-containing protein [Phycisphaerae bacterium]HRT40786.1 type 1 glutamine amidotransferase domain-containing protein [Phycisphaerae bacterium]